MVLSILRDSSDLMKCKIQFDLLSLLLGNPLPNKIDEFSEKLRTAFGPLPPFWDFFQTLKFLQKFHKSSRAEASLLFAS